MKMRLTLQMGHEASSVGLVRQVLEQALVHFGVTEEDRQDLRLAVDEACANVITHAGDASDFEVLVAVDNENCTVEVHDQGPGVDLAALPDRILLDAESGRGLHIIRSVADEVELQARKPHGLTVRMTKRLA